MKSRDEVENLKQNWMDDPCWDIEETEGFEDHRNELAGFRAGVEFDRRQDWEWRLKQFAGKIGLSDNLKVAEYIRLLEDRISKLEVKNDLDD